MFILKRTKPAQTEADTKLCLLCGTRRPLERVLAGLGRTAHWHITQQPGAVETVLKAHQKSKPAAPVAEVMLMTRPADNIRQMEEDICHLFGEKSYRLERRACTGKYRGHNDYTLIFDSGRRLYIGLDKRNYPNALREQLRFIQSFRANQQANSEKLRAAVLGHGDRFTDVYVDVVPYDATKALTLYGAVILVMKGGLELVYRSSNMHFYLVGVESDWCSYDRCLEHLLTDAYGRQSFIHLRSAMEPEERKGA